MLLRVPEDVHRRLAARAKREGRSLNATATEILDAAAGADNGDRQARLRASAARAGHLDRAAVPPVQPRVEAALRDRIIASTRGLGPQVDHLLDEDRDPR